MIIYILDNFEEWSAWSVCSGTCGVGTRKRSRTCKAGFECFGQFEQTEICTTPCRLADCPSMTLINITLILSLLLLLSLLLQIIEPFLSTLLHYIDPNPFSAVKIDFQVPALSSSRIPET